MDASLLSRKTKSSLGGVINEGAADISCEFGRRMLAKFGWKEGKGLGKHENGMQTHIKVKQRAENLGLGAGGDGSSSWDKPETLAAPPAAALAETAKRQKKKDKKRKKEAAEEAAAAALEQTVDGKPSENSSGVVPGLSDVDLFKLCGGARLGMRARASQGGKQSRMAQADADFLAKYGGGGGGSGGAATGSSAPPAKGADDAGGKKAKKPSKEERKAAKKAERKAMRKAAAAAMVAAAVDGVAVSAGAASSTKSPKEKKQKRSR